QHTQVAGAGGPLIELRRVGPHERLRQPADVLTTLRLVEIKNRVPSHLDVGAMLVEDRPDESIAILEPVLNGQHILSPRLASDLAQAHRVDTPDQVELFGSADEPVARVCRALGHRLYAGDHAIPPSTLRIAPVV